MAGLETWSAANSPIFWSPQAGEIFESLLKNQTGRPYSAPHGGPRRVLLPFLAEDPVLLYHRRKYFTSPKGVQFLRSPNRRLVQNTRAPHGMQEATSKISSRLVRNHTGSPVSN